MICHSLSLSLLSLLSLLSFLSWFCWLSTHDPHGLLVVMTDHSSSQRLPSSKRLQANPMYSL